jgi:serine O-acetyltransferase
MLTRRLPRLSRLSRQLSTSAHTWQSILTEAEAQVLKFDAAEKTERSFGIRHFVRADVLAHDSLASALSTTVGDKLAANSASDHVDYKSILMSAFESKPDICDAVAADIERFKVIDPACDGLLGVYLFYKGVHALACARVANHYWEERGETGRLIAKLLQSEMADVFGVDIHPGCKLGRGVTIDHATGVTLGETCVVGDNVYIMHDVTLGATGKAKEHDRHPKIGRGVFLGAKCTVLGNIRIGDGATIAAAALVNKPVPDGYTAVGMPARMIAPKGESTRSQMDLGRAK